MLDVSRSGFYKWKHAVPSPRQLRKERVMERIRYHFEENSRRYGSPRITKILHAEGLVITERTVGIYMREMGLRSCVAKK
ncbi:IS3 family transposase [Paenibacillus lycopersici]|uniref:IS3 family transposase n=2 Tax=Paenibacillus lycopersici TaxID=2704462 RepID=A0A6C0G068_9BACL|nr:IS3 family transposase [Paenibacillus lycopersici]